MAEKFKLLPHFDLTSYGAKSDLFPLVSGTPEFKTNPTNNIG
jgi:hypothetical protein